VTKIDDAIREALSAEDAEFLARFDREPPAAVQAIGIFRGAYGLLNVAFLAAFLVVGAIGLFAVWKFATLEETRALLHWGAIAAFCVAVLAVIRLWFFMELQTSRIVREIKRLELQVARLAARDTV
jgi:hypothetical protein